MDLLRVRPDTDQINDRYRLVARKWLIWLWRLTIGNPIREPQEESLWQVYPEWMQRSLCPRRGHSIFCHGPTDRLRPTHIVQGHLPCSELPGLNMNLFGNCLPTNTQTGIYPDVWATGPSQAGLSAGPSQEADRHFSKWKHLQKQWKGSPHAGTQSFLQTPALMAGMC